MKNLTATEARDMSKMTPRYSRRAIDVHIRREAKKEKFEVYLRGREISDEVIDGLERDLFAVTKVSNKVYRIQWSSVDTTKEKS